jgi:hypothetical protein
VSSGAHGITGIRWDDVHFTRGYDRWQAYGQSKTANVLFAVQLDALGRDAGVKAFAVHPGSILTPLQRHLSKEEMMAAGWIDANGALADRSFKTPEQGAATQVWAATSPQFDGLGGVYCEDCDIAPLAADDSSPGVRRHAVDPEQAARLWALSGELTGVDAVRAAPSGDGVDLHFAVDAAQPDILRHRLELPRCQQIPGPGVIDDRTSDEDRLRVRETLHT